MKIQTSFAIIALALVALITGCNSKPSAQTYYHEQTVKALEMRSLHVIEDKTDLSASDPLDRLGGKVTFIGYVKDDHGNCFYATTLPSNHGYEQLALATVPCDSLAPKK